jgi:hypothetical protein
MDVMDEAYVLDWTSDTDEMGDRTLVMRTR